MFIGLLCVTVQKQTKTRFFGAAAVTVVWGQRLVVAVRFGVEAILLVRENGDYKLNDIVAKIATSDLMLRRLYFTFFGARPATSD